MNKIGRKRIAFRRSSETSVLLFLKLRVSSQKSFQTNHNDLFVVEGRGGGIKE